MKLKFARQTVVVQQGNDRYRLRKGEAWDANAPIVTQRPELFDDQPPEDVVRGVVEQATAAPGEKRRTRRG